MSDSSRLPKGSRWKMKDLWYSTDGLSWAEVEQDLYEYWLLKNSPENIELERQLESADLPTIFNGMNSEQFKMFLNDKYYQWKFASKPNALSENRDRLNTADRSTLDYVRSVLVSPGARGDRELLIMLAANVPGLGIVAGSGLLALTFPHRFGTVDRMVVRAFHKADLFLSVKETGITEQQAAQMIEAMRDKARELTIANRRVNAVWTPRRIDRALWANRGDKLLLKRPR